MHAGREVPCGAWPELKNGPGPELELELGPEPAWANIVRKCNATQCNTSE